MRFVFAAAVILALAALAACSSREAATAASQQGGTSPASQAAAAPPVEVVKVVSQKLDRTIRLPGELLPYEVVSLYPKVTSFVEWIGVDRGSRVGRGQLLARMSAPELASQRAEAEARVQAARAQRLEAEARMVSDDGTFQRLKAASATPGVVAGNDVSVAQKTVEADRARVQAIRESETAAEAALKSLRQMEAYLQITAPFNGVITERNAHPGSLAGASGAGGTTPMLKLEQVSRLRLVVAVPEVDAGAIAVGRRVGFSVPAFPGETFQGVIARVSASLDPKTRSMPVELDVANPSGRLAPGMFPEVAWPVRRARATLFVPPAAVVTTTERTFVVRVRDGKTEWVDVKRGASAGSLVEVFGDLREGDDVVRRGTDELRPGTAVTIRAPSEPRS